MNFGRCVWQGRAVADLFRKGCPGDDMGGRILDTVKGELIVRYGHELGVRLDGEFYEAFEGAAKPRPVV